MAGLDPAIQLRAPEFVALDGRLKGGHDQWRTQ
jgi:hypothetical protein